MVNRRSFLMASTAMAGLSLTGCAGSARPSGWITLVDGTQVPSNWRALGDGQWSVVDGTLQGKNGKAGYLVTPDSYSDFEIRAEFWADEEANSGIFIRCQDPQKVGANNSYEVNIWDKRPDLTYGTGAIVDFAAVNTPYPKVTNRWNVYEIMARGDRIVVTLNGRQTADLVGAQWRSGPIALQSAGGTIRFRSVLIRHM